MDLGDRERCKGQEGIYSSSHTSALKEPSVWGGFPTPSPPNQAGWPRGSLTSRLRGSSTCSMSE